MLFLDYLSAASKDLFHRLVVLCWYLTTVKEVINVVCVTNIVGIVACKFQGLLYASNFAEMVIFWL